MSGEKTIDDSRPQELESENPPPADLDAAPARTGNAAPPPDLDLDPSAETAPPEPLEPPKPVVREDVWIPTSCHMCFNGCHIRVRRKDGVAVKIEGLKDSPVGEGHVCGKGAAGLMRLYDPHRVTKPLKRTNPEKGRDLDPGWEEISWEECYRILGEKIEKTLARKGPRGLGAHGSAGDLPGAFNLIAFFNHALGSPNFVLPDLGGAALHGVAELLTTGGNAAPDYQYCKYVLQFGAQAGTASREGFNMTVRRFAEARAKGCRLVSVDPHMSPGPEKADLWLPIRPGTDAALALSLACVLIHELGVYDTHYLKKFTNAASLVDVATSRMLREKDSHKPYVWDLAAGGPLVFDDPAVKNLALGGQFTVDGRTCKTGFQLYADLAAKYPPEEAAKITSVPAELIRQVARELGEAASIGSTITLDGQEFPYRPAAVDTAAGLSRHRHAYLAHWACLSLNTLIGSVNVPGGFIAFAPRNLGCPETGKPSWRPGVWEEENLLEQTDLNFADPVSVYRRVRQGVKDRGDLALLGLMPFNSFDSHFLYPVQMNPKKYGREKMDLLFVQTADPLKDWGNSAEMGEFLKSFDFIAGMDSYLTDSSYYYDLFIPEASYLERYDFPPTLHGNRFTNWSHRVDWCWGLRQPVVEPRDGAPGAGDFFNELARRLGKTAEWNGALNRMWKMEGKEALEPEVSYTFPEILDRIYKNWFGPKHGLDWFREHGMFKYPRKVEEMYLFPLVKSRIPFYWDFVLEAGEKVAAEARRLGIADWDSGDYRPLPEFKPGPDRAGGEEGYDLTPIYYANGLNNGAQLAHNPWINEINENDPYGYTIEINSRTAREKGLKSGDRVAMRAPNGFEAGGRLMVVEGLHPECLAVCGGRGDSFSQYMPVAKGRGAAVNNLLEALGTERLDHLSAAYDQDVRVKIVKL